MNKKGLAIGAGLGLVAWWVLLGDAGAASGQLFVVKNGVRYWSPGLKGRLTKILDLHTVKETGTDRVVQFEFSSDKPGQNGLGWVRKMQAGGYVCTSSSNLLDETDPRPRMVAAILPGEEPKLASADLAVGDISVAVLPPGV